jgi:hypothetical protein
MAPIEPEPRRWRSTQAEVTAALAALEPAAVRIAAADWPGSLVCLDQPGLYSWWVDVTGAHELERGLGMAVSPGRIYAGLTGATKWPSGEVGKMSLRERIGRNHLAGTIRGSTFRRTLAAILREPIGLRLEAPGRLERESERGLSVWMRQRLDVAVHPFPDRDALANLEDEVLAALDPPLNLEGVPPTALRVRLRGLRAELGR